MRTLKHTCGQPLDLTYVPRTVVDRQGRESVSREPALACPEHGVIPLAEVEPRGAVCVVRELAS